MNFKELLNEYLKTSNVIINYYENEIKNNESISSQDINNIKKCIEELSSLIDSLMQTKEKGINNVDLLFYETCLNSIKNRFNHAKTLISNNLFEQEKAAYLEEIKTIPVLNNSTSRVIKNPTNQIELDYGKAALQMEKDEKNIKSLSIEELPSFDLENNEVYKFFCEFFSKINKSNNPLKVGNILKEKMNNPELFGKIIFDRDTYFEHYSDKILSAAAKEANLNVNDNRTVFKTLLFTIIAIIMNLDLIKKSDDLTEQEMINYITLSKTYHNLYIEKIEQKQAKMTLEQK